MGMPRNLFRWWRGWGLIKNMEKIGCVEIGGFPFHITEGIIKTESMPELLGYLTVALLIAYLFIHFGWKWVKREPPKSNKIFAIPIIMFLFINCFNPQNPDKIHFRF